jgi:hypothetical protein
MRRPRRTQRPLGPLCPHGQFPDRPQRQRRLETAGEAPEVPSVRCCGAAMASTLWATAPGWAPGGAKAAALAAGPARRTNWRDCSTSRAWGLRPAVSASRAWRTSEPRLPALAPPAGPPKTVPAAVAAMGRTVFTHGRSPVAPPVVMPFQAFLPSVPRHWSSAAALVPPRSARAHAIASASLKGRSIAVKKRIALALSPVHEQASGCNSALRVLSSPGPSC